MANDVNFKVKKSLDIGAIQGEAPIITQSTTLVTNLNADKLDGMDASSSNVNSTVVSRDSAGNFSAGTATVNSLVSTGILNANGGIYQDGIILLNGTDTWFRSTDNTGWQSATYGGGIYMTDTEFVQTFNSKALKATYFSSTVNTGTAPLQVLSTTLNTNLNADLLDGQHGSFYASVQNLADLINDTTPSLTNVYSSNKTNLAYEPKNSNIQSHISDSTIHLSSIQKTDLTDSGDSSLHYHSSDRNRSNHSGTQTASTISDFTETVQDVIGVSLLDTSSINLTYDDVNNQIKAEAIFGTTSGVIAEGSHNHSGVYEPADASILKSSSIGVSVQANLGFTPENPANKGQINGYASLDGGGKVPSSQLPSYVDDVVEYVNFASLPVTGSSGLVYITLDDNKIYRWTGSAYISLVASGGVAVSVANPLVIKLDSGTTEGTDLYTFDGSASKNIDIKAGTNVSLTKSAGSVTINATAAPYTLPAGTSAILGGVKLFSDVVQSVAANVVSTTASRSYGLQLNASGQLVTNIPWTDTDTNTFPTTYTWTAGTTAGPTASITGTSSTISVAAVPSASTGASGVVTTGTQAFAGIKTFASSFTEFTTSSSIQDGIYISGRAGGTTSLRTTIVPGTLSASNTLTLPITTGTLALTSQLTSGTVTSVIAGNGMTQSGTSTINPTLDIVSHAGTAGSIGTINIGADAIGVNLGSTSTTACSGADSRLSDARTPLAHTHGNITNAGAIGSTASLPIITTTSGVLTTGTFGTTSGTFAAGDHTHSGFQPLSNDLTNIDALTGTTGFLKKTATDTWALDTNTYGNGTVTSVSGDSIISVATGTTTPALTHSVADGFLHVPATGTTNNGKVLTAGATAGSLSWGTVSGGSAIADDTATNSTFYPLFTSVTTGTPSTINVSTTKLNFNPSTGNLSSTTFTSLSDRNLKENINIITNGLEKINLINPVEFSFIESKKKSAGVIAQELEEILPNLVLTNSEGIKSVEYTALIGYLISAVQELSREINLLKLK